LNNASCRGKQHVGRDRPDNNRLDVARLKSALRQGFARSLDCQVAGRDTFLDNVTLANPDARHDPFIVGVDHALKVGIGKKTRRHIRAQSANFGADRFAQ